MSYAYHLYSSFYNYAGASVKYYYLIEILSVPAGLLRYINKSKVPLIF